MANNSNSKSGFVWERLWNIFDNVVANTIVFALPIAISVVVGIILKQVQITILIVLIISQSIIIGLLLSMREKLSYHFLKFRKDFPPTEEVIADASEQIWVSGIALDTMAQLTKLFQEKIANEGFSLRFLAINPEGDTVEKTANYLDEDPENLAGRLQVNLRKLHARLAQERPNQVEIRVVSRRPTLGYFIIDPRSEKGYMTVEGYLAQTERHERPIFRLSKKADTKWFKVYLQDFDRVWKEALRWNPNS